ncbi:MAG: DEAD/DEAH box helicase [Bacillota bacterium]
MNELIINNDISQLILESETVHKTIWNSLRFRDKNYFHSSGYQLFRKTRGKKGWDGFVDFYSKTTGKFPTGLLPEILKAINVLKIKPKITDNRSKPIKNNEIKEDILSDYEDKNGNLIYLYDYQCDLGNKAWKYERGIIEAATGAGKTFLFMSMIKSIPPNTPTLILFRSKTLANQTYKQFKKFGIENAGILHGEEKDFNIILCATIRMIEKYPNLLSKFEVLIADEVHEFATNKSIQFFKKMKRCRYRIGFSATPWNPGDTIKKYKLKSWFGPILGSITTEQLQNQKNVHGDYILSKSKCYFHIIDSPDIEGQSYQAAYNLGVVYNKQLHKKVKEIIDSYDKGRILTIVERIDHGDDLSAIIKNCYWIEGKDDEETRNYVIEKLQKSNENEKSVAIATRILQTGVDLFLHALINGAGYKSYIMTKQRIGRGLRPSKDKEYLEYHDFYFTNNKYLEDHSKQRIKWLKREGHPIYLVYKNGDIKQIAGEDK